MKTIKKLLVLLVFTLVSINLYADERLYKIEVIVFSQNSADTEVFEQTETKIDWPKRVVARSSYKKVDPEYMMLNDSFAKLARGKNYYPLMHVAWVQAVESNRSSTAVQITNPQGTLDGFFRLQRGNLIHMIADIEYSPDLYEGSVIYRLNEKRRFKLNETHYLDHPKFGIIARVSPVTEE